jgi:signal peptidase I
MTTGASLQAEAKSPLNKPALCSVQSPVKQRLRVFWREWILPAAVMMAVLTPLRSVVADWNDVPSGSMMPTILVGDRIFINKLAYDLKVPFTTWHMATWADPQRGDIIVFRSPVDGTRLVKRVVAGPGDLVELRDDHLFINGGAASYELIDDQAPAALVLNETVSGKTHSLLIEPQRLALRSFGPIEVPSNRYFVMGDNRNNSFDSRHWGFVPRDRILGRATMVALSFDRDRHWRPRFNRFLQELL